MPFLPMAYRRAEGHSGTASVGFYNQDIGSWGQGIARVFFYGDGTIRTEDGSTISVFDAGRWYKVKVILDMDTENYYVWINDILEAESINEPDANYVKSFILDSAHAGIRAYFDDVLVKTLSYPSVAGTVVGETGEHLLLKHHHS